MHMQALSAGKRTHHRSTTGAFFTSRRFVYFVATCLLSRFAFSLSFFRFFFFFFFFSNYLGPGRVYIFILFLQ